MGTQVLNPTDMLFRGKVVEKLKKDRKRRDTKVRWIIHYHSV